MCCAVAELHGSGLHDKAVHMAQAAQARSGVEEREASHSRRLESRGYGDGPPEEVRLVVAPTSLEVGATRGSTCAAEAHGAAAEGLR